VEAGHQLWPEAFLGIGPLGPYLRLNLGDGEKLWFSARAGELLLWSGSFQGKGVMKAPPYTGLGQVKSPKFKLCR
jgi:hypothetical protein